MFKDLVSLEKLSLDAPENFTFGEGFSQLAQMVNVEASSYYKTCHNYEIQINPESFHFLSKISQLTLRGCAFRKFHNRSLSDLSRLHSLNVACASKLEAESLFHAIHNMNNATLETLILDGILLFDKTPQIAQPFHDINFRNVKRLSSRGNLIVFGLNFTDNGTGADPGFDRGGPDRDRPKLLTVHSSVV